MATTYEIVQGIHQAAANAYDGSHDERFTDPDMVVKIGLRREEGCAIKDSRVIDGFKVKVLGDTLFLMYHTEFTSKQAHQNGLESDIEQSMADIVKFLKKEYKKITESTLSLTKPSDVDINMQYISRQRVSVVATQKFNIGGVQAEHVGLPTEDRLDKAIKDFLSLGREKAKKPSNVENTIKEGKNRALQEEVKAALNEEENKAIFVVAPNEGYNQPRVTIVHNGKVYHDEFGGHDLEKAYPESEDLPGRLQHLRKEAVRVRDNAGKGYKGAPRGADPEGAMQVAKNNVERFAAAIAHYDLGGAAYEIEYVKHAFGDASKREPYFE